MVELVWLMIVIMTLIEPRHIRQVGEVSMAHNIVQDFKITSINCNRNILKPTCRRISAWVHSVKKAQTTYTSMFTYSIYDNFITDDILIRLNPLKTVQQFPLHMYWVSRRDWSKHFNDLLIEIYKIATYNACCLYYKFLANTSSLTMLFLRYPLMYANQITIIYSRSIQLYIDSCCFFFFARYVYYL